MRRAWVAAVAATALALAAGCQRQPGFDERYASAEAALGSEAAAIDSDLSARESDAAAAEAIMGTPSPAAR